MKNEKLVPRKTSQTIIKKCHCCGTLMESEREVERCTKCRKAFLPSHYFNKVHAKNSDEYRQLFDFAQDLHEDDLVKGLCVLW